MEVAEGRQQFTFYRSFWEAAKRIKNRSARADLFDTICRYALDFEEPDLDKLPDAVAVAFVAVRPNLDASRKKAEAGKQGGSKPKASASTEEASESKNKYKTKDKNKDKNKIEGEKEKKHPLSDELFSLFWDQYPAVGRENREEAQGDWENLEMDEPRMRHVLAMLDAWKASKRWTEDGGAYIPNMSNFLDPKRQYIHAAPGGSTPLQRAMDEDEKAAIRRMMGKE